MDYTLIRSKRKTAAIHIRGGCVEVRAPLKMSRRDIDSFVTSKEKWIAKTLTASQEVLELKEAFSLDYGDTVIYRGKEYPIAAKAGNRAGFDGVSFYIPPGLAPEQIISACAGIYRMIAKRDLTRKIMDFAEQMGAAPSAVKVNGAKSRWGSCSGKRSVNFSWRLIMADDEVIDYVVVHELAHLTEMNHSERFWKLVENILPDYRERQEKLKALQRRLSSENWE